MVTTKSLSTRFALVFLLLACFLFTPAFSAVAETSSESVAILPFDVHAAEDLTYLRNGIRDMLASRMATGVGVSIVSKAKVDAIIGKTSTDAPNFQSLAEQLNANYLIAGSYTSLGGGASIDAKVYSSGLRTTQDFFATAPGQADVIMAINNLAWDIGEKVFGKAKPAQTANGSRPAPAAQIQQPAPVYQTAHPERAYLGNTGPGSPFIKPTGMGGAFGFTKSQNFRMSLQAMDIGDIDGDGIDDAVLCDRQKISAYRIIDGKFALLGEWSISPRYAIHYVSLADLNNNGKSEIYVSASNVNDPNSLAIEWTGESFSLLFDSARMYIRAMNVPGEGMALVAQKGGDAHPFEPGLFLVKQVDKRLSKVQLIHAPDEINIFDFIFTDLEADGRVEIATITQNDRIHIMKQSGKNIWLSGDYFGGTKRFVGETTEELRADLYAEQERYYIPSRLISVDLNNDKKPDIVANKNLSSASRVIKNLKSYPNGEIHGLAWNGIALAELWHTSKIDGYIADYQLKFVNEDEGKAILYVGVIISSGGLDLLSANDSTILMYPLDLSPQDDKQTSQ